MLNQLTTNEIHNGAIAMPAERDFDTHMLTLQCSEEDTRFDFYISLTTVKGYKQEGDKEVHVNLSFVNECGTYTITDIPLSSLKKLTKLLNARLSDWGKMVVEDIVVKDVKYE